MFETHYPALVVSYGAGVAAWSAASYRIPSLWPVEGEAWAPSKRWTALGQMMLAIIGVVVVGQLFTAGRLVPGTGPLIGSLNQILIFSPVLLLVALPGNGPSSAWLTRDRIGWRLGCGIVTGVVAVSTYALVRQGTETPWSILAGIWHPPNLDEAVQVLLEDVAIAALFIRVAALMGKHRAVILVAVLFAAGHIPPLLAGGAPLEELTGLLLDAGLGVALISVLQYSRDILWFWMLHFHMDMTQFDGIVLP